MLSASMPTSLFDNEILFGTYDPFEDEPEDDAQVILPASTPAARVLEPRWYQQEAWRLIDEGFFVKQHRAQLLVLPTGCGKTAVAAQWIGGRLQKKESVLILCDLERLLKQMNDDLAEEGIFPIIEKAESRALSDFGGDDICVLGSMQTLRGDRLEQWPRDIFDWIVIDEAHEFQYLRILEHFHTARVLGLTATPYRSDGKSLRGIFAYPFIKLLSLRDAIEGYNALTGQYENPFLSRIKVLDVPAEHIDLTKIKIVGKDYDKHELDMLIVEHTEYLASAIVQHAGDRPTWVYCPQIHTADAMAAALRDMNMKAAAYHSKIDNCASVLKAFERGDLQFLTNVNMLIKGVNVPKVSCIARVRATLTPGPMIQEIGRGTRLSPATGKEDCLVIQFNFKADPKHKLASVVDAILDGVDEPDETVSKVEFTRRQTVRERTDKIIKSKEEIDLLKAHRLAQQQITEEEQQAKQAKQDARRAKYKKSETAIKGQGYDPFSGLDKVIANDNLTRPEPASAEQIALIAELSQGLCPGEKLSAAAADKKIRDLRWRKNNNRSSEKQRRMMCDWLGCDPRIATNMHKFEARKWIDGRLLEVQSKLVYEAGYSWEQAKALKPWELLPRLKKEGIADE